MNYNESNAQLIIAERKRQIEVEGFTDKNDDTYRDNELGKAAASYLMSPLYRYFNWDKPTYWPDKWSVKWWKPAKDNSISGRKRELIKAGALILSEMDRLDRLEKKVMITPSIEQIELAIMKYGDFNFRQNLIVFRVTGLSGVVNHECDCLIMTKTGYLTEIEIKRSYEDFLNDFKKNHLHEDNHIKYFYFMVHESFKDKVIEKLIEMKRVPSGVYVYDDECNISIEIMEKEIIERISDDDYFSYSNSWTAKKLFLEEQYQLARLGAMRYKNMTEKCRNSNNE